MVRPGLLLYGIVPPPLASTIPLTPVMSLTSRVVAVKGVAWTVPEQEWSNQLYQAVPPSHPVHITAIPYYAWDNRQPGLMKGKIWIGPDFDDPLPDKILAAFRGDRD